MNRIIILTLLIAIMTIISCSFTNNKSYNEIPCEDNHQRTIGLINKLIDEPDDLIDILESEKCVDCDSILTELNNKKWLKDNYIRMLSLMEDNMCDISEGGMVVINNKPSIQFDIGCKFDREPDSPHQGLLFTVRFLQDSINGLKFHKFFQIQ